VIKGLGYGCDEEAVRVIKATNYRNSTGEEAELRMKIAFSICEISIKIIDVMYYNSMRCY
jgi:hypothetical protein